MSQPKLVSLVILLALTLNLSCVEDSTNNAKPAVNPNVGETVPALEIPKLLQADGRESITLEELKGSTVVLEFWATWCGPCVRAIPHMNELVDEFAGDEGVRFISVTREPESTVTAFMRNHPMHAWIGLDRSGKLQQAFDVSAIPTAIVIDPEGEVVQVMHPMQLDAQTIRQVHNGQ